MTELIARIQAALGDSFHVERELGGGGMSRLFLATEASARGMPVDRAITAIVSAGATAGLGLGGARKP